MPSDKHHNATPGKPFTPILSSAFRSSKSPLTPRVAGSVTPHSSNVFRRGGTIDSTSTPNLMRKDSDISTPVSAFLNSNVTPRSGSRKARVDSSPTTSVGTPNGTPVHSRATSTVETGGRGLDSGKDWTGLGITTYNGRNKARSRSERSDFEDMDLNDQPDSRGDSQDVITTAATPLFFYADDAKSAVSGQEPNVKPALTAKPPTFFYANGTTEGVSNRMRANGTSSQDGLPSKLACINSSTSGRSPPSSALNIRSTSPPKSNLQYQPSSPLKESHPAKRFPPHSTTLSRPTSRLDDMTSPPIASGKPQQPVCTEKRRTSVGSSRQYIHHAKSGSIDSTSSVPFRGPSRSSSLKISPKGTSMSTAMNAPVPSPRISDSGPRGHPQSPSAPLSPTKSSESSHGANILQQADLAASARRERKVLDLEISNSSLLAINRTLEREMRKQTAELRRYKRLSRAGRLSMIPGPSRAVSGLTTFSENDPSPLFKSSPTSPTASEFSLDLSLPSSDDESSLVTDDGPMSPATQAAHDARHRKKDEARLHLDLTKHQQLLVDSQKMNQSIQRCLGWTEELIKEGKKALEYHVRVSDVELGGKVLIPDEVELDPESQEDQDAIGGGRLLSPSLDVERVFWSGLGDGTNGGDGIASVDEELDSGEDPGGTRYLRASSPFVTTPGVD